MANTNELDYSRKVADGERLELIMRQVASRFKLDGNGLAEALLDIHERLKAVEGATEELTSSDRWKAFKTVQLVKPSPSASGDTVTAIDTLSQDENGELTATKKNIRKGTTSQTGIVQLSDATNSTSTAIAATANAVKRAYDLAASKLDKDGLGDDVTVGFTEATSRTNIVTGSKLSTLFGQIRKWFADMGTLAFKDTVGASDVESGTYPIGISGNAATATTATTATSATTASATSSGAIQGGDDLNSYNVANRTYLCSSANATTVSNKPSGASGAFELEVIRGTGNTCVQVYYSRDNVNFNYIRKRTGLNDGAWTDWVKLIDSSDVISPNYSAATLAYDASGESLLFNLSKVSVYGEIVSTSYCQLKIVPKSGSIRTDRSVIKSFNSNFDSFRIYNYPWSSSPGSNAYTPNIQYNNNNIGTIDIDLVTTQTVVIHLTVWYIADTAAGLYRFYIVEEVKT